MSKGVQISLVVMICGAVGLAQTRQAGEQVLDVKSLEIAMAATPQGADADRLAERIRTMFGGRDALMQGVAPKTDETTVAWALELPAMPTTGEKTPRVSRDVGGVT